jgi:hypothetical protein
MALNSVHPRYAELVPEWVRLRDFVKGERAVKNKGQEYLPATKGMILDGIGTVASGKPKLGQEVYDAYLMRAVFPEYIADALEIFMGMLHNKGAVIELPEQLEYLRDNATELGEPLEILLQRINQEQLTTGRLGLLADMPKNPDPLNPEPFIALYVAEAIRNWDVTPVKEERAELNLVILDESRFEMDDNFNWQTLYRYRVLRMDKQFDETTGRLLSSTYLCGAFSSLGATPGYDPEQMFPPMLRGVEQPSIPFVFVNSKDITADPDEPPLNPLARLCGAIYRGEADYRQNLFMQGQDTLVIIGDRIKPLDTDPAKDEPLRTGAGSRIELEQGGDAKYVGVQSQGLTEQRYALENDRKRAESRSGQLIDAAKGAKESGTALKTRVGAQTATLNQIAKTGALALELILKKIAFWKGADPAQVKVTPNLEFADYQMSGQDLVNLMTAKRTGGAPLSEESIHRLMVQGNLTQYDYVTERDKIAGEEPFETPEAKLARELAEKNTQTDTGDSVSNPGPAPADPANPAPVE